MKNKANLKLRIDGMTCSGCSSHIEKDLITKDGVETCSIDHETGIGEFSFNSNSLNEDDIIKAVNSVGNYTVTEKLDSVKSNTKTPEEIKLNGNYDYDLIIIGGGSAAFSAMTTANDNGIKVLMINGGLPMGGTCVNVGCVPSKFLIRAGESIHQSEHSPFNGIIPIAPIVDFKKIIQEKKQLVEEMRKKKYLKVADSVTNTKFITGWAHFIDDTTVSVNDTNYSGKRILIATGAQTNIPNIQGLQEVGYLTNISLFELEEKPESLTILGAGYIGLEIAQAYSRLGVKIRILEFTDRVIRTQTPDVSEEVQAQFKRENIEVLPNVRIQKVQKIDDEILIHALDPRGNPIEFIEKGNIVVATGTSPNTNNMGIENTNLNLDKKGHIEVNGLQETSVGNIYAAGDCSNTPAFVYTAAVEGKNAVLNAFNIQESQTDYSALPWVVFTDPQIAGVGMDENEAGKRNIPFEVTKLPLSEVPRAIAAKNTKGFIKLVRNSSNDKIIGARIVASEGGELIMEAALAVKYGITATQLAETFHPYLTLSEGLKIAAITFTKNVEELSCCAT